MTRSIPGLDWTELVLKLQTQPLHVFVLNVSRSSKSYEVTHFFEPQGMSPEIEHFPSCRPFAILILLIPPRRSHSTRSPSPA
jgi:hypothetical protein